MFGLVYLIISTLFMVCGTISSISYKSSSAVRCPMARRLSMIGSLIEYTAGVLFFVLAILSTGGG